MAWDSGATPIVLLTKSDLCDDIEEKLRDTQYVAAGVDVHFISCVDKSGFESIRKYIVPGRTIAFLGSSGVGKSSIINELAGEIRQEVQEISSIEGKGRHTTTNRELILLPGGGIVIDTPGMREFHLMDAAESVDSTFKDVESLGKLCRFSDCTHMNEPGCAVKDAVRSGAMDEKRLESYNKLKKEAEFMEKKASLKAARGNKRNGKKESRNSYSALED
jgi:ribosome biogenesis GTPase